VDNGRINIDMNRQSALAQFNKLNKKFTTVLALIEDQSLLNHDLYLYREIEIDINNENVRGTYDSYEIYDVNATPLMTEDLLNTMARNRIVEKYPLESQLSILGSVLEQVADANAISCNELKEMNDFISEVKRVNGIRKEFYRTNSQFEYKSTEDIDAEIAEKYEGAIQEYGDDIRDL
jgi:hypothetical protein